MTYYEQLLEQKGMKLTDEQLSIRNAWFVQQTDQTRRYKPIREIVKVQKSAFDSAGNRICSACKTPKPADCYGKGSSKIDGKDARCKPCKSQSVMRYRMSKGI